MAEVTARIIEIFVASATPHTSPFYISVIQEIYKDGQYSRSSQELIRYPYSSIFNEGYNTMTREFEYG